MTPCINQAEPGLSTQPGSGTRRRSAQRCKRRGKPLIHGEAAAPLLETMSGDPLGHRAEKKNILSTHPAQASPWLGT